MMPPRHLLPVCCLVLLACGPATPIANAVTVSVAPAETTVAVGETFTLRVITGAFPDLKGYELIHAYDPARLLLLAANPGDVLTGTGNPHSTFLVPDADAPLDSVWYDCAMLVGSTSGPGVLAYYTFRAEHTGDAVIECRLVDFRDSHNGRTLPGCDGGVVHIEGPVPVQPSTWGRVKALYR